MDAFEPTAPLPNGASVEGKKELPAIKSEPEDANKGMIIEILKIDEKYIDEYYLASRTINLYLYGLEFDKWYYYVKIVLPI